METLQTPALKWNSPRVYLRLSWSPLVGLSSVPSLFSSISGLEMDLKSLFVRFCLLAVCSSPLQVDARVPDRLSELLFGKLWTFDQFCGHKVSDQLAEATLDEAAKFYNKTTITEIASSHRQEALCALTRLNRLAIRIRSSLTVLCSKNSWGYADEEPSDGVDASECLEKIQLMHSLVLSLQDQPSQCHQNDSGADLADTGDMWLRINNFGRVPSAYPFTNHLWLGDYRSCLELASSRYCFGHFNRMDWPNDGHAFRVGLCLPRCCSSELTKSKVAMARLDAIIKYNLNGEFASDHIYQLTDLYCPPTEDSPSRVIFPDAESKTLIAGLLLWFAMLTYYSSTAGPKGRGLLRGAFDLRASVREFLGSSVRRGSQFIILDAIKVIAMNWLMFAHLYVIFTHYTSNMQDVRSDMSENLLGSFVLQGQHVVPVFLLISGFLVGHKELRKPRSDALRLVVYRYLRLLPMYLVVYAFVKRFAHLMGSGPLWDYAVSPESEARQCRLESWLVPVLMLANFIAPFSHCILTGWHIANDFQIFLLLPLLFAAYRRSRRLGTIVSVAGFVASHLHHMFNFSTHKSFVWKQLNYEPVTTGIRILMDHQAFDYVNPFGRVGTYFLGVVLADLLMDRERQQIAAGEIDAPRAKDPTAIASGASSGEIVGRTRGKRLAPEVSIALGSLLVVVAMSTSAWPSWLVSSADWLGPFAYPLCRLAVELGSFALLYGLLVVKWTCRAELWNQLVKLNYCLMLTHFSVARYLIQSKTQLVQFTWANMFEFATFCMLVSYTLALVLHLTLERPLTELIKGLTSKLDPR